MRLIISLIILSLLAGCGEKEKTPDISGISVELKTKRFEREFFKIDSISFGPGFDSLLAVYPEFGGYFLSLILGASPEWGNDSVNSYAAGFAKAYRKIYDTSQILFSDFSKYEKEIVTASKYFKYYFPEHKLPGKIITYLGPMDGYGDILSEDAFLVGLHHHLGENYSLYHSEWLVQTYPKYVSDRFVPENIAVNCMFNLLSDLYPEQLAEKTLVNQMVEKGKRLYTLEKLLPEKGDHLLIGYSAEQMKDCYVHERTIWDFFIQNNYLQSADVNITRNYIGESPKTQELGESAPGNIGSFSGWQIVRAYMKKNPGKDLKELMKEDPEKVFREARYKP
jgi:hypothetical protein